MKSLFIKVLSLLLGSFFLVLVTAFGLFWWINIQLNPADSHLHHRSLVVAEELVDAARAGDTRRKIDRLLRRGVHAWVLDQTNRPLSGPPAPPEIMAQVTRFPIVIRPFQNQAGKQFIFAHAVDRGGSTYRVILSSGRRDALRDRPSRLFWLPIVAVLLGLVVASVLLSHWILRPLRTFRQTASEISGDSLQARIPLSVTQRKDAFGELGREFNRMTHRVERTLESQKQLLRDVSHELRSPLSRIQMAASLSNQKRGRSTEVDRIETEVARLDSLIENLLSISRITTGAEFASEDVDLNSVLHQVCEDANFEFQSSRKKAITQFGTDLQIKGDSNLLSSAFENVVRNALRFSPDQSNVEVSTEKLDGVIQVTVADSGPGVADEILPNIFDPFFKADTARSETEGQHGIGLALSRAIIELHGGEISAKNRAPHGLLVRMSFPC